MDKNPEFPRSFLQALGKSLRTDVPLLEHSHFRIGGPADFFFEARTPDDLKSARRAARGEGISCYVIGGGFNLLFDDAGYRGLIIKNSCREMGSSGPDLCLRAAGGASLGDLVACAAENGWEGLEFLAGIPGTVGGAVFGNAGAFGQCIGDVLEEAVLASGDDEERRVLRTYFEFGYRHSRLKIRHDILLEARFRLRPGHREEIRARIEENLAVRARKHPPQGTAYAGSFFKNPPPGPDGTKKAAGFLLERVGAKDLKVGGAAVYPGHGNFLINANRATAKDVLALAAELKRRVKETFGIELEEEVIFLPAASSMS
jgi:UDP-N-acetylmuramate dehydrogenase